jgi:predicted dehydrogenase
MNLQQAQRMVETARVNNTFLMEAVWTRFIPMFEETLRLLKEGVIGEIKTVRADFGFRANFPPEHRVFNVELGGGALLDVGIYPVFLALALLGKPHQIKAAAAFGDTGADESCAMLFRYASERLAILDASIANHSATEAYIYGENGTIHLHPRFHHPEEISIHYYDKPSEHLALHYTGNGYFHEILEVMDCLRQGRKESKKLPLDFSLQLTEVLDAVRNEAGIVYPEFD